MKRRLTSSCSAFDPSNISDVFDRPNLSSETWLRFPDCDEEQARFDGPTFAHLDKVIFGERVLTMDSTSGGHCYNFFSQIIMVPQPISRLEIQRNNRVCVSLSLQQQTAQFRRPSCWCWSTSILLRTKSRSIFSWKSVLRSSSRKDSRPSCKRLRKATSKAGKYPANASPNLCT